MRCPGALESQRDAVETTVAASEAAVEPHNPLTHPWPPATERPPANLHMGHDVGHASRPDWRLCARVGYSFDGVNAPARLEHPRPYDGPGVPQRCGSVLWGASVVPDAASIEKKHRETQRDGSLRCKMQLHFAPPPQGREPSAYYLLPRRSIPERVVVRRIKIISISYQMALTSREQSAVLVVVPLCTMFAGALAPLPLSLSLLTQPPSSTRTC